MMDLSCKIYDLNYLAVISVSGEDSAKFLQGQITCDINSVTNSRLSIAAFCNPKGRVITSLFIFKTKAGFKLILPACLIEKVYKKLKIYILRSAVQLETNNTTIRLFGIKILANDQLTETEFFNNSQLLIFDYPFSTNRYLFILDQDNFNVFSLSTLKDAPQGDWTEWFYADINSGMPWLTLEQSEEYTPQMLNIDTLGGVSFNKGCYTGQEIIARTHFLGKAKRHLFIAECEEQIDSTKDINVLENDSGKIIGKVLAIQTYFGLTRLQVILQIADTSLSNLALDDDNRSSIKIVDNL